MTAERPWSMTDEARAPRPRDHRPPGPVSRVLRRVLWAGVNLYVGWWAVIGTLIAVVALDDVSDRPAGDLVFVVVGAAVALSAVAAVGVLLGIVLRRLVTDLRRRDFVLGSVVAFGVPHLYFLAVVAGIPLPWRLPGW